MWDPVCVKTLVLLCVAGYYGRLTRGIIPVQLVDSFGLTNISSGCLELFNGDMWTTVCISTFNERVADFVCKELQYNYASVFGTTNKCSFSKDVTSISCSSQALNLSSCSISPSNCSHSLDVSLTCTNKPSPVRLVSESGRTTDLSAGRLEIYINKRWGTVCDDFFSIADANVACRQMGFEGANSYSSTSFIGYEVVSASTPIWLDNPGCSSSSINNSDLRLCPHAGVGVQDCDHNEDVILSCINSGFLRLNYSSVSNTLRNYGRLEIYWNGAWGTVCYEPSFSTTTALVACRQLGFNGVNCYGTVSDLGYKTALPTQDILLDGVSCSSSILTTLLKCFHNAIGFVNSSCTHSSDVVLSCSALSLLGRSICSSDVTVNGGGGGGGRGSSSSISSIVGAVTTLALIATTIAITCIFVCLSASGATRHGHHSHRPHRRTVVPNLVEVDSNSTITGGVIPFLIHPLGPDSSEFTDFPPLDSVGMQIEPYSGATSTFQDGPPPSYRYATAKPPAYNNIPHPSGPKTPNSQRIKIVVPHDRRGSVSHPTQEEQSTAMHREDTTPHPSQVEPSSTQEPGTTIPHPTQGEGSSRGEGSATSHQRQGKDRSVDPHLTQGETQGESSSLYPRQEERGSAAPHPSQKGGSFVPPSQVEETVTQNSTQIEVGVVPHPAPYPTQREGTIFPFKPQGNSEDLD